LLIIDKFGNESYTVEENYCLDIDKSGHFFAFTCVTQVEEQIAFAKVITFKTSVSTKNELIVLISGNFCCCFNAYIDALSVIS